MSIFSIFSKKKNVKKNTKEKKSYEDMKKEELGDIASTSLEEHEKGIKDIFDEATDLIKHPLTLRTDTKMLLYYFEGLTDGVALKDNVIHPLLHEVHEDWQVLEPHTIACYAAKVKTWDEVGKGLLQGQSVLFIDGYNEALVINTKGWAERSVEESKTETTIKGSHDGFVENISKNIGLIRRYVPTSELKIKKTILGERAETEVYIMYLGDVANQDVVKEVEKRIKKIEVDTILNIGTLSRYIEDNTWSPFPQSYTTERPDATAAQILQGKVVIMVDRSPAAMVVPINLTGFLQTPDDYNTNWLVATFIRILRYIGFAMALFLPAIYIAIISFHFEVVPLSLYLSIAESRAKVPFSPFLEAIFMEITLEMLREAGVRLPPPVGQTIGIVGGIVIGQAAVQAGMVSNIMVIVVSITAIASFIIPNSDLSSSIRLIRFPMMVIAYFYGMIGIVIGMMILVVHLITLESFGTPYGVPIAPIRWKDLKDTFVRLPESTLTKRPKAANTVQEQKQSESNGDANG
jgi:spore germination protein